MINPYDLSVFINKKLTVNIIIAVYVNDLLVCGSFMNLINYVLKHLQSEFEMTDLGEVANYLGMEIDVTANSITVHQHEYIQSVFECFCINECKLMVILMLFSTKLIAYQEPFNAECQTWYRSAVGLLMWFATQCRSDIVYSMRVVLWYFSNLNEEHKWAVLQIFCYLKNTVDWGLIYIKNDDDHLVDYSDSDYVDDIITH